MFPFDSPEGIFDFGNLSIGAAVTNGLLAKENLEGLWDRPSTHPKSPITPTELYTTAKSNGNGTSTSTSNRISSSKSITTTSCTSQAATVLLSNLPDDFKPREVENMFAFAQGIESCTLTAFGSALIKFASQEEAAAAVRLLDGYVIDRQRGVVIKAELFKKESSSGNSGMAGIVGSTLTGLGLAGSSSTITAESSSTIPTGSASTINAGSHTTTLPAMIPPATISNTAGSSTPSLKPSRSMTISVPGFKDPAVIEEPPSASSTASLDEPALAAPIPIPVPIGSLGSAGSSGGSIEKALSSPNTHLVPPSQSSQLLSSQTLSSPTGQTLSSQALSSPTGQSLSSQKPQQQSLPLSELSNFQKGLIAAGQLGSLAAVVGENFPCNTLYVGNLPPAAGEEELRALFKHCFGYRRLSFKPKSSGPMCFVEFEDIACATAALETLYGTMLSCSNPAKGGIRLSYSKNPLGLRVASPVCDVSVLGNVHAVSSLIKMSPGGADSMLGTPFFGSSLTPLMEIPEHRMAISNIMSHYNKQR